MPNNQMPVVNSNFDYTIPINGVGERVLLLETENKFVDKNIVIRTSTAAAGTATLNIRDKGSSDITVGTVSGGYYPLSTSLIGDVTFASAGWINTDGFSAISQTQGTPDGLTDTSVVVGRIAQSTLKNGSTAINSGAVITPNPTSSQTINISEGYNGARTVVVAAMNSGTKAVATTNATATAPTPTLVSEASAVGSKVQVSPSEVGITNIPGNLTAAKYYMALRAATANIANGSFTKTQNVTTAGYLGGVGSTTQITASASVTGSNELYYVPLTTGSVNITANKTATAPTLAERGNSTITNKTQVSSTPTTGNSFSQTFYVAVTATAPATTIDGDNVTTTVTDGYINSSDVTAGLIQTNQSTTNYYIPLNSAVLKAGTGIVSAAKGSLVSITESSSVPASGSHYFTVTGSGKTGVQTAGYIAAGTDLITSNTTTKYYTIPSATFTTSGNIIKSNTAGYIDANVEVGTITSKELRVSETDPGNGYTAKTNVIVPSGGYLVLDAGYYSAQKVSLATLIPDASNLTVATDIQLRQNYSAYDKDGNLIAGAMPEYDGTYTLS